VQELFGITGKLYGLTETLRENDDFSLGDDDFCLGRDDCSLGMTNRFKPIEAIFMQKAVYWDHQSLVLGVLALNSLRYNDVHEHACKCHHQIFPSDWWQLCTRTRKSLKSAPSRPIRGFLTVKDRQRKHVKNRESVCYCLLQWMQNALAAFYIVAASWFFFILHPHLQ